MKLINLLSIAVLFQSCAMIFRDNRQQVSFKNGSDENVTVISSPDGKIEIEGGSGVFMMTRTKSDIQIKVKCKEGDKVKQQIIQTKFDGLSTIGDVLIFWPAIFVDPFQDKFYNIPEINLGCE